MSTRKKSGMQREPHIHGHMMYRLFNNEREIIVLIHNRSKRNKMQIEEKIICILVMSNQQNYCMFYLLLSPTKKYIYIEDNGSEVLCNHHPI